MKKGVMRGCHATGISISGESGLFRIVTPLERGTKWFEYNSNGNDFSACYVEQSSFVAGLSEEHVPLECLPKATKVEQLTEQELCPKNS
ncbi:MAG: hypothetical protein MUC43_19090 [Pirellula sp.]|jgi:hypothetical protein|nr:hypothetical protein [Pirellula sp.]